MDSVTQFALGAGVGLAFLGRRLGLRKAALTGGVLGTLPDLDVFYPFADPVAAFVLHRGASHSLFVQAALTPVLGEGLRRVFRPLRERRWLTYGAVYACLATHALLDALTVYGTRILWPLWPDPVGIGSVFIIDPLYTVPLLVILAWALWSGTWTRRFGRGLTTAFAFTTAYLGWTLLAQQVALARASAILDERGIAAERLMATPTPFNSLLWRAIAIGDDGYFNLYIPVLEPAEQVPVYAHARGIAQVGCTDNIDAARTLADFSKGFYRLEVQDDRVILADLRMGLTPGYVFRFMIGRVEDGAVVPVAPERVRTPRTTDGDLEWLLASLLNGAAIRPAEAAAVLDEGGVARRPDDGPDRSIC